MAALKRRKLLKIELENPERSLYCLALIISSEAINKRVENAAQIMRNVAEYMGEPDRDSFAASCLSRAGFGMDSRVDIVGKLGHLERLCEAVYDHMGFALPDYQACEGIAPINAVWRSLPRDGGRVDVPMVQSAVNEVKQTAPWVKGRLKSGVL